MTTLQQPATIIGGPVSPYVRKVLVACELKGVPYRLDPIVPFFGGDKFSELNPLRRIPVYIDDKVSISDSTVICEYLDQRFADPPILPADVAQRAQARWIEEFADTRLGHVAIRLFYESVVGPLVFQAKRDKDRIAAIVASEVPDIMATLERLAPADGFLFEQPCVADVSVAVFFANLKWARLELDRNRWPKALTWVDRTTATPALAKITRIAEKLMEVMPDGHRAALAEMGVALTDTTVATSAPRRGPSMG